MKFCSILMMFLYSLNLYAQSVIDDISTEVNQEQSSALFTERINRISSSKKIFIITNENAQLNKGDFISLLNGKDIAARALVVKIKNNIAGIKIIKIYSLINWSKLWVGKDIQIIRGDDSYYKKIAKNKKNGDKKKEDPLKATPRDPYIDKFGNSSVSELEDLYNETDEVKTDRIIKTDNILSVTYKRSIKEDALGNESSLNIGRISWSYQVLSNVWVEGNFSRAAAIENFPGPGDSTGIDTLSASIKRCFSGPLYTYFMPFVGFEYHTVNSPDYEIGSASLLNREHEIIDDLNGTKIALGVTILKRLVPGWFLRGDITINGFDIGVSIEF